MNQELFLSISSKEVVLTFPIITLYIFSRILNNFMRRNILSHNLGLEKVAMEIFLAFLTSPERLFLQQAAPKK